jgi:hypothetical protein
MSDLGMPHWLSRFHILLSSVAGDFLPVHAPHIRQRYALGFAMDVRGFPLHSHSSNVPARIMAMWVAGAAGLSVNLTSSHTIPAGGTVTVVWAPDDVTVNPSQFSLYVSREGGTDETVATQVVDASTSGTATMVVPPATSPGLVFAVLLSLRC